MNLISIRENGFINKLYFYYCQKGYYNIISTQIVNLLISNFMILFIMFLVNCVDFIGIFKTEIIMSNWGNIFIGINFS